MEKTRQQQIREARQKVVVIKLEHQHRQIRKKPRNNHDRP